MYYFCENKHVCKDISELKIAFISDQQYPIDKADSEQTVNTVSALANQGLDVTLIVPRKWRNAFKRSPALKAELVDFYTVDDSFKLVELLHSPLTFLRAEKYFHGLLGPVYAAIRRFDVIFTRNPMVAFVALALQRKVVFETYKLYDRNKLALAKLLVKLTFHPNLAGIITHSDLSRDKLIQLGAVASKIAVMHNGFNPRHLLPQLSKREARLRLGWDEHAKIACYTGSIQKLKGIEHILDIAMRTPEVNYYLVGKYREASRTWLEEELSMRALRNVRRFDWVRQKELSTYLYASDFLIIPPTAAPMARYGKTVLPIKLFIYLAAGRPVLAPALADSRGLLSEKNAVLVEPDDVPSAVQAIRSIFGNPGTMQQIAAQALKDSKELTWERRAERLKRFLNDIFESREVADERLEVVPD